MFGQTTMKSRFKRRQQGEEQESNDMDFGNVADAGHDLVELVELQYHLLIADLREGKWKAIGTVIIAATAVMLFMGSIPALTFGAGWLLANSTELSIPQAFVVVGGIVLALAVILGLTFVFMAGRLGNIFKRSRHEFKANMRWLKHTLKTKS